MYIIVLGFVILRLQMSVSLPFPTHMDFQKVGEVIFNNEKYNVLKPTTHVVSDYFKDFMLRRDNIDFPTKRVFIDHNGFRHAWSGFGDKIKSLRKTGHVHKNINENSTLIDAKTTKNETATVGRETQVSDESNQENNSTENIDLNHKYTEDNETSNEATTNNNSATEEDISNLEDLSKIKLRDSDKTASARKGNATTSAPDGNTTKKADTTTKAPKKVESSRTVAQTTFFCPYFGIITMSAFID